jgi:hypothetical protein
MDSTRINKEILQRNIKNLNFGLWNIGRWIQIARKNIYPGWVNIKPVCEFLLIEKTNANQRWWLLDKGI